MSFCSPQHSHLGHNRLCLVLMLALELRLSVSFPLLMFFLARYYHPPSFTLGARFATLSPFLSLFPSSTGIGVGVIVERKEKRDSSSLSLKPINNVYALEYLESSSSLIRYHFINDKYETIVTFRKKKLQTVMRLRGRISKDEYSSILRQAGNQRRVKIENRDSDSRSPLKRSDQSVRR